MAKKKPTEPELTMDEKMDMVLEYLHRMDRRDHWRTVGGFFRGLLGLIPIALMLLSVWYFYYYGDDLIRRITEQAAEQAARMTSDQASGFMQQFQLMFPGSAQQ